MQLQPISLNNSAKERCCLIMAKGNTLLKECAEMMGLDNRAFRGLLFRKKLDITNLNPEQLDKLNEAIPAIYAVRDQCENKILHNYCKLARKRALVAAHGNATNFDEYYQEGIIAIVDAIYGYTNTSINLTTFVYKCVQNGINKAVNRANPFCPLTAEALKLRHGFNVKKSELNRRTNDTEVVEAMGLSDKESKILFAANINVVNEIFALNSINDDHFDDYTSSRRNVNRDVKEVYVIRKDARQAIKDANLSDAELGVLIGNMFPYTGWQENVASKHINPSTNKRFTRAAIPHILERAIKKVKVVYMQPPTTHKENVLVDKLFDELSGKFEK